MWNPYWLGIYLARKYVITPSRYRNLINLVFKHRCQSIMEIGVYSGDNSRRMIETAKIFHNSQEIEYFGFDLFEELTDEMLQKEFSKEPPAEEVVRRKLEETGVNIFLSQGKTQNTLPKFVRHQDDRRAPDFIFIDGGHHVETIESDWRNVKRIMSEQTVVLFDDYYENDQPRFDTIGCQNIVDSIDSREFNIRLLEPVDHFEKEWGTLKIRTVEVTRRV